MNLSLLLSHYHIRICRIYSMRTVHLLKVFFSAAIGGMHSCCCCYSLSLDGDTRHRHRCFLHCICCVHIVRFQKEIVAKRSQSLRVSGREREIRYMRIHMSMTYFLFQYKMTRHVRMQLGCFNNCTKNKETK